MSDKLIDNRIEKIETQELGEEVPEIVRAVAEQAPEMFEAYCQWRDEVLFKDGTLPTKVKLLAAVSIMTVLKEPEAVYMYSKIALNAGATKAELLEAMAVGVLFSGGPGIVAMGKALTKL